MDVVIVLSFFEVEDSLDKLEDDMFATTVVSGMRGN